jgi:18S rRNA (guanine1575-N7)-methyltransferase
MIADRPELQGPPELYYDDKEANKYSQNSRIRAIQSEMSLRAVELLELDHDVPNFVLDLGCGSGLSGQVLSAKNCYWLGLDISRPMLQVASLSLTSEDSDQDSTKEEMGAEIADEVKSVSDSDNSDSYEDSKWNGDLSDDSSSTDEEVEEVSDERGVGTGLMLADMGKGLSYLQPGVFDGAISISALQWLCHSNRSTEHPRQRLMALFRTLFSALAPGARAVFQFYPSDPRQTDLVLHCARRCGFNGGLVIDFSDSPRAKKFYLCLMTSHGTPMPHPQSHAASDRREAEHIQVADRTRLIGHRRKRANKLSHKDWVDKKIATRRRRGEHTRHESKYSGRHRKPRF